MIRWLLPVAMIAAIGTGAAMAATSATHSSAPVVKTVASAKFGKVLVNAGGRTLYRYTLDSKGVNRCTSNATCATAVDTSVVGAPSLPNTARSPSSNLAAHSHNGSSGQRSPRTRRNERE